MRNSRKQIMNSTPIIVWRKKQLCADLWVALPQILGLSTYHCPCFWALGLLELAALPDFPSQGPLLMFPVPPGSLPGVMKGRALKDAISYNIRAVCRLHFTDHPRVPSVALG